MDFHQIRIEHNGKKRSFNVDDIDAITNIGNNTQKKEDQTSIGKFGVGFKAVFAYTDTPYIHSGNKHFRIRDHFIPEFFDVLPIETQDENGEEWTIFIIPFNSQKKDKRKAFQECSDGLNNLDHDSILFLRNIEMIEYSVNSGEWCSISRKNPDVHNQYLIETIVRHSALRESRSNWLRFVKETSLIDEGYSKRLSIGVAFPMHQNIKKGFLSSKNVDGKVFIYFPATKEQSGLKFHINAPFASTVARASIRDCEGNKRVLADLADLTVSSIESIWKMGLLDNSFISLLPVSTDYLPSMYEVFRIKIFECFIKNKYIRAVNGVEVSPGEGVLYSRKMFESLFSPRDLRTIYGRKRFWITTPNSTSRVVQFFKDIGIPTFSTETFVNLFSQIHTSTLALVLKGKPIEWLLSFYDACYSVDIYYSSTHSTLKKLDEFRKMMKRSKMILNENSEYVEPTRVYLYSDNALAYFKEGSMIVNHEVSWNGIFGKNVDPKVVNTHELMKRCLGIEEFGQEQIIRRRLERYDGKVFAPDEEYFKDLLEFASSWKNLSVDYSNSRLWFFVDPVTKNRSALPIEANRIVLGDRYGNHNNQRIGDELNQLMKSQNVLQHYLFLWSGYAERYSSEELSVVLNFAEHCGLKKDLLEIQKTTAESNKYFFEKLQSLYSPTSKKISEDYKIIDLQHLLTQNNRELSYAVAEALSRIPDWRLEIIAKAKYRPNARATVKTCDSSLLIDLKEKPWIPRASGGFARPSLIKLDDVEPDFRELIKTYVAYLSFNEIKLREEDATDKARKLIETMGGMVVFGEKAELFRKFLENEKKRAEKKEKSIRTTEELLSSQTKHQHPFPGTNKSFDAEAINNISRRERAFADDFQEKKNGKSKKQNYIRQTQISNKEEKDLLEIWYGGKCQICGTNIIDYRNRPYFHAVNIISTSDLPKSLCNTEQLGWNSICLCPNCAARYRVCAKDITGMLDQVLNTTIQEGEEENIAVHFELDGQTQTLYFVPKHFFAFQQVLPRLQEYLETEPIVIDENIQDEE